MATIESMKHEVGYKRIANKCGNCVYYEPTVILGKGGEIEHKLRDKPLCTLGQFVVSSKAWCERHVSVNSINHEESKGV